MHVRASRAEDSMFPACQCEAVSCRTTTQDWECVHAFVLSIPKYWLSVPIAVLVFGTLISISTEYLGQITDNIVLCYFPKDTFIKHCTEQ